MRPGRTVRPLPWPDNLELDEAGLGADSLERLKLGTALAETLHFAHSGVDASLFALRTLGEWVSTVGRGLDAYSATVTFRTSGSTGEPKWCVHQLADLWLEIDAQGPRFADRRRIVSAVPSHHIYGFLFTILLAQWLGVEVIDVRANVPAAIATTLRDGDLVIGHPTFWEAFTRGTPAFAPHVAGVTSTAPCPAHVARAVRATGIEQLVEIYGSSETAGIGWRDEPGAPFELLPYWRRGAADGELVRVRPDGTHASCAVPDVLEWDSDARHLRPLGRREGAVQVGGTNVFVQHVRDVLIEHPGVAAAAVRLMRPDEGERLKAFIVPFDPNADRVALRAELWTWIESRLQAPEQPKAIEFGAALPIGPHGKPIDWLISAGTAD